MHPTNVNDKMHERRMMSDQQKKGNKNHHRSRTILLTVISYTEYEKITNKYS